jgi:DNA invertase Pin-like site-specific DNA recombinase
VAYFRTSSAANVGAGKDTVQRQRDAVTAYAEARGLEIVREFHDAAVSGADPIDRRPGFVELLAHVHGDGARAILVENASRFARDLAVQLAGHDLLKARGIDLVPVDAPDHFRDETPTAVMVRQILGAVAQFEKAGLVRKLRHARDSKSAALGRRVEGRKPVPGAVIREAERLARKSPKTGKSRTLRAIADELAALGYLSPSGRPYLPGSVKNMLAK